MVSRDGLTGLGFIGFGILFIYIAAVAQLVILAWIGILFIFVGIGINIWKGSNSNWVRFGK
jgi:hypothetical protein